MSFIGWIILGLISGFIANKLVNKTGDGFFIDIVLGIVGAIVGGFLFSAVGIGGVTGLNLYSMVRCCHRGDCGVGGLSLRRRAAGILSGEATSWGC